MNPQGFTLMSKIRGDRKELERLLRTKGDGLQNGSLLMFGSLQRLHSLSVFIVDGEGDAPWLVTEANYDGELRAFLDDLIAHEPEFVETIYSRCEGYPQRDGGPIAALGRSPSAAIREYLVGQVRANQAYYVGCPSHTNERIDIEQRLGTELVDLMHKHIPHGRRSDLLNSVWAKLPQAVQDHVRAVSDAPQAPPRTELGNLAAWGGRWIWRGVLASGFVAFGLIALAWFEAPLAASFTAPAALVASVASWGTGLAMAVAGLSVMALIVSAMLLPKRATNAFRRAAFRGAFSRIAAATLRGIPGFIAGLGVVALYVWAWRVLLVTIGVVVAIGLLALGIAALILLVHVLNERNETFQELTWDPVREAQMRRREDRGPVNHFIGITTVKDTPLRVLTVRAVLWGIGFLARFVDERRGLSNIKSIHFARWLLLPKDPGRKSRRLLFVAHYDGSWAGYLGDFVMNAPRGVTAIWGNTRGCPRHGFWFSGGVRDEQRFKCYARASQVESLLWFVRKSDLTVGAIQRNARARNLLANVVPGLRRERQDVSEADVDAFLRLF